MTSVSGCTICRTQPCGATGAYTRHCGGYDGDEADLELMRTIEKQQKKEMEQMMAKHAQQNDRMKKMIKERRAKEKQDQKRAEWEEGEREEGRERGHGLHGGERG